MSVPQQAFLRDAMRRLNMTRETFAGRIGVSRRALDTWLSARRLAGIACHAGDCRAIRVRDRLACAKPARERIYAERRLKSLASQMLGKASRSCCRSISSRATRWKRCFASPTSCSLSRGARKISRVLEGAVLAQSVLRGQHANPHELRRGVLPARRFRLRHDRLTFSSMAKGESIYDTSRVMSGYVDALVIRHPEQGSVAEFARATNVPVINGGDGPGEHPSQALLDLYTIQREFSRLGKIVDGAHIALVGDLKYGRTVHSLVKLLALYRGIKFTLIPPPMLEMPGYIVEQIFAQRACDRTDSRSAERACAAPTWCTRRAFRKNALPTNRSKASRPTFEINQALVDSVCGTDTLIMHPLPRDSRPGANDLSVDLNHDSRLAIFRQTDNGIPVRMAIFAVLLGVEKLVQHSMRDAGPGARPRISARTTPCFMASTEAASVI